MNLNKICYYKYLPIDIIMYLSDNNFIKGMSYEALPLLSDQLNVINWQTSDDTVYYNWLYLYNLYFTN